MADTDNGEKRPTKRARIAAAASEESEKQKLKGAAPYARIDLSKDLSKTIQGPHKNKKLQSRLATISKSHRATAVSSFEHDHLLLPNDNAGLLEPENDVEKTWRISQQEIKEDVGVSAAAKGFDLNLDNFGPYSMDYTSNGRHLAIGGRRGHVATFDWHSGKLHTELQLNETVRDICWLHDQSFFAVAQKKYVYIYDKQGVEIHQLRHHIDVNRLQFLRYHFLLSSIGSAGYLKYQDTSTGQVVCEHKTKLGACDTMAQNTHNGIIHLGHSNGTVTLWSPNMSTPHVKLLAHKGPVQSIAIDQGSTLGHYMATSGLDGRLKVWDNRKWEVVNEWSMQKPAQSLTFSQKGLLAVGWGNHVSIYKDVFTPVNRRLGPYMTTPFPSKPVSDLQFCPYEDILGVGHSNGFTSLLIPGAGEANFDSTEADPFESKKSRQEREVASLLDKIQPDQITLDRDWIGKLARPDAKTGTSRLGAKATGPKEKGIGPRQDQAVFRKMSRADRLVAKGQADSDTIALAEGEDERHLEGVEQRGHKPVTEKSGKRVIGKNKEKKRALRKRANVIDAKTEAIKLRAQQKRETAQKAREAAAKGVTSTSEGADGQPKSALDRFASRR